MPKTVQITNPSQPSTFAILTRELNKSKIVKRTGLFAIKINESSITYKN